MSQTFPVSQCGVEKELEDAMKDVQATCAEFGVPIEIRLRGESNVTRDKYNSIKKHVDTDIVYTFGANPLQFNPSSKQLEKAGIKEPCEAVAWTAMQDWIDNDLTWNDIDVVRSTVVAMGQEMEIKGKGYANQLGSNFLYITLGLVRK